MKKYNLAQDSFDQEEIEAAIQVLHSGKYTMGQKVREFESEIAKWCGAKHAIMVNSGSSANLLIIESLLRRSISEGLLKAGDEVLVPALSWPTTVWPVLQLGLVPVFVDVDPQTLAMDMKSAERSLSTKTKALFLIHVLGLSADMNEVLAFCNKHKIVLIEDCCESFGTFYEGKHVGLFGQAGSLSHFFSHHLTTMEGGTIITNDSDLYEDLKSFRAHGWVRDRQDKQYWKDKYPQFDDRFMFITTGYNVRPMEIQAAVGLVQLKKIEGFLSKREQVAFEIKDLCQRKTPFLKLIGSEFIVKSNSYKGRRHSWMNLPFEIDQKSSVSRQKVIQILEEAGVETRPIIAGNLARHPACSKYNVITRDSLGVCDSILERGFMIGCHPNSTSEEVNVLTKAIEQIGSIAK